MRGGKERGGEEEREVGKGERRGKGRGGGKGRGPSPQKKILAPPLTLPVYCLIMWAVKLRCGLVRGWYEYELVSYTLVLLTTK